jgi:signal transduction histidine kinase
MLRISNIQLSAANAETMRQKELVEQQNEHLQKLDQEKNEMMGLVAHDLKNPISAIRNLANLIETNQLEKEVVLDVAQSIATTSNRMLSLVSNLLDLNRLESGAMAFRIFSIDILPSVEGVFRQYQSQAAAKNITLHCTVEAVSTAALVDEQAIIEVLENLISNAVKYSPHGKNVFVRLNDEGKGQKEQDADSALPPAFLRVEVQDEGPGISPEDMKKLFTKFARLSAQPTGDEQSTGLGLSIVKKMVEAMNGKVWCESELGKGATFIVELPCATFIPDSDEASG